MDKRAEFGRVIHEPLLRSGARPPEVMLKISTPDEFRRGLENFLYDALVADGYFARMTDDHVVADAVMEARGVFEARDSAVANLLAETLGYERGDGGYDIDLMTDELATQVRDNLKIVNDRDQAINTHELHHSPHDPMSSMWCKRCAYAGIRPDTYDALFRQKR